MARNLARSCSSVLGEIELGNDGVLYLVEKVSKQSVEEVAWFFLTASSKM